jgi:hypothetical protein
MTDPWGNRVPTYLWSIWPAVIAGAWVAGAWCGERLKKRRRRVYGPPPTVRLGSCPMVEQMARGLGRTYLREQKARGFTPTGSVWVEYTAVDCTRRRLRVWR